MSDLHKLPACPASLLEFPVCHARGGTSTGLILAREDLPEDEALVEELLRHLMGVPLAGEWPGNSQITGLGRGGPTSNKVFIVERRPGQTRMISTLAQLAAGKSTIDWSVNCGNMSAALPLYAWQRGWLSPEVNDGQIEIYNSNTQTTLRARLGFHAGRLLSDTRIPGVNGQFPGIDLFLDDPVGAKTGALFPTGQRIDLLQGIAATCIDVAVPMVIVRATDLGKTGQETPAQLDADPLFKERLLGLMVEGGLRMGLRRRDGGLLTAEELRRSETIPKICIVSPAREGGDIATRYFTPQNAHPSLAVSGGCCLAAACLAEGTVAQQLLAQPRQLSATRSEYPLAIENPAGILETLISARVHGGELSIDGAAYRRSAQILLQGRTPLYNASPELLQALL
ncbi:PrpF domain-containing protein [Pseudomonas piscis]|uniref:PrpF domain-containing protein n=1 Tax=Pseudomonas piscis TaxID=2614538 RepID=A0ABY9NBP3_9PSED|nr:PrpF domain-containing protein [Pseudomonas piscis]WMN15148.1 PrpF domain-containing protein [Pseudomonas piscis]